MCVLIRSYSRSLVKRLYMIDQHYWHQLQIVNSWFHIIVRHFLTNHQIFVIFQAETATASLTTAGRRGWDADTWWPQDATASKMGVRNGRENHRIVVKMPMGWWKRWPSWLRYCMTECHKLYSSAEILTNRTHCCKDGISITAKNPATPSGAEPPSHLSTDTRVLVGSQS